VTSPSWSSLFRTFVQLSIFRNNNTPTEYNSCEGIPRLYPWFSESWREGRRKSFLKEKSSLLGERFISEVKKCKTDQSDQHTKNSAFTPTEPIFFVTVHQDPTTPSHHTSLSTCHNPPHSPNSQTHSPSANSKET